MASEPPEPSSAPPATQDTAGDAQPEGRGSSPAELVDRARLRDADPESDSAEDAGDAAPGPEQALNAAAELEKLRTQGLADFYGMRLTWSRWLIGWVTALIAFQILLTGAIGAGALDFRGYDVFLGLTVGQNFVQVVALAMIVVRFLHSRDKDDAPL